MEGNTEETKEFGNLIKGKEVAQKIREDLKQEVESLKGKGSEMSWI